MDTIQAAVLRSSDGPYAIEPVKLDDPGPEQLVVRVRAAGYCHSDMLPRAEGFPQPPPLITGHECRRRGMGGLAGNRRVSR
jgi:aryl-alcohol dehydrogenase